MNGKKSRLHNQNTKLRVQKRTLWWYLASLLVLVVSAVLAARHYPGGFDWQYTVASALASQKHNPDGSVWFASGFLLSMVLLWPYVARIKQAMVLEFPATIIAIGLMQIGLICGVLVATERLFLRDLSAWLYKSHEILAILFFLGWYLGIFILLVQIMLRRKLFVLPVIIINTPLLAIGITQFWLYLKQRDLGWVDTSWREMGVPLWLSFAFWQWLAIVFLWAGLGLLALIRPEHRDPINQFDAKQPGVQIKK